MKNFENLKKITDTAPSDPGCYLWKNQENEILYIGKAKNLYRRITSYIQGFSKLDTKIQNMILQASTVEWLVVDSDVEALLLETNLIKKYTPKYNKLMKDDKNYSWVKITWHKPYPTIYIVRDKKQDKSEYYGPFPKRFPIIKVMKKLRKQFPYCSKLPNLKQEGDKIHGFRKKPCFNYHIGLCNGVCANLVSKDIHRKNINAIRQFLKGRKYKITQELQIQMNQKVKEKNFEEAAKIRDQIENIKYITGRIEIDQKTDDENLKEKKEEARKLALKNLIESIHYENLKIKNNFKIECYDISNIQGTNPVGSMVVFINGLPKKSYYRKFKIKSKNTPDDFAMMSEVLNRRIKKVKDSDDPSFSVTPDLIIVDGGKGQLSSAKQILEEFEVNIPIIGLAKQQEEIFKIEDEYFVGITLPRNSESLYLIQRIRDEAHRFAITFHRSTRGKKMTQSILTQIPGIGEKTQKKLLRQYGSISSIKKAKIDELAQIVKNKTALETLLEYIK